jgi:hypothetical protein
MPSPLLLLHAIGWDIKSHPSLWEGIALFSMGLVNSVIRILLHVGLSLGLADQIKQRAV